RAIRLRELDEIVSGIPVLGQRGHFAELLPHARLERARERLELIAGVVDVELRRDPRALRAEQSRERVTDRGRARVDDHQRSGRIRGDELETNALRGLALTAPVRGARGENLAERAGAPR